MSGRAAELPVIPQYCTEECRREVSHAPQTQFCSRLLRYSWRHRCCPRRSILKWIRSGRENVQTRPSLACAKTWKPPTNGQTHGTAPAKRSKDGSPARDQLGGIRIRPKSFPASAGLQAKQVLQASCLTRRSGWQLASQPADGPRSPRQPR